MLCRTGVWRVRSLRAVAQFLRLAAVQAAVVPLLLLRGVHLLPAAPHLVPRHVQGPLRPHGLRAILLGRLGTLHQPRVQGAWRDGPGRGPPTLSRARAGTGRAL